MKGRTQFKPKINLLVARISEHGTQSMDDDNTSSKVIHSSKHDELSLQNRFIIQSSDVFPIDFNSISLSINYFPSFALFRLSCRWKLKSL